MTPIPASKKCDLHTATLASQCAGSVILIPTVCRAWITAGMGAKACRTDAPGGVWIAAAVQSLQLGRASTPAPLVMLTLSSSTCEFQKGKEGIPL